LDYKVLMRTTVLTFALIGLGAISRKVEILRAGDGRMFSSYTYHFALPVQMFVGLIETSFIENTLWFMLTAVAPIL